MTNLTTWETATLNRIESGTTRRHTGGSSGLLFVGAPMSTRTIKSGRNVSIRHNTSNKTEALKFGRATKKSELRNKVDREREDAL